jgi:serine/threonine protein kinase
VRGEEADARSDLFSYGAVLSEMATGVRAFDSARNRSTTPVASSELARIIEKAMQDDPSRRYQQAREMRADLQRLAALPGERAAAALRSKRPGSPRSL